MRQIDDMTPQQLEMLTLKGMLPERRHEKLTVSKSFLSQEKADNGYTPYMREQLAKAKAQRGHFDFEREHEHDLEEESRRDYETWETDQDARKRAQDARKRVLMRRMGHSGG